VPTGTLPELIAEQARRTPDAVAVQDSRSEISYLQLDVRANRLAHRLRKLGAGPDTPIGVCLDRGCELMVVLLAVLKAGAAYVPLDPDYPPERLRYMLEDTAAPLVLTERRVEERLPATAALAVCIGAPEFSELESAAPPARAERGSANDLAYVIYTSGSTGNPKGVMVEHRSLVASTLARREYYGRYERFLLVPSFSFDSSVAGIYGTLATGGTLILASAEQSRDPAMLLAEMKRHAVTDVLCVPSLYAALLAVVPLHGPPLSVKRVIVAGEKCPASLVEESAQALPGVRLFNEYGPTEASVWATVAECSRTPAHTVPIGRPVRGAAVYLLDAHLQPVPIGVHGEICIGGNGVARGYLNHPELTAARFVEDPFDPGARLYRTADLGRWSAQSAIEFVGRTDRQVKIRGYRVEPEEIEARLRAHASIADAAVVVREGSQGGAELIGYYATRSEAPPEEQVRAHLAETLPPYMIPTALVPLSQLPLTPNGKIDRDALPEPNAQWPRAADAADGPEGDVEEALASIFSELLQIDRIGRSQSFFDLGGHSLLAVQAVVRIHAVLGFEVPVRALFETPTIEGLARHLSGIQRAPLPPVETADRSQPLPLSLAQQRLWFIDRLQRTGAAYHIATGARLHGALDETALRWALDAMVQRHEILRTSFREQESGEPVQVISSASTFALERVCLPDLDPADRAARIPRIAEEAANAPFDLEAGPLIRGVLIELQADEHVLLLLMHHIVADGWSMGIFVEELAQLYVARSMGRSAPLAPLPIQYADYAAWQRQWLRGEVLDAQVRYWARHLADAPPLLQLPTDFPRPAVESYRGERIGVHLDAELARALGKLARSHDATLFMVLHAGLVALLARLSAQPDIVVGVSVANRQRSEVERLIGFFTNTLALRVQLQDDVTVRDLLSQVRRVALEGFAHQELPFEKVVEVVQPPRSLSHSPIFQVMLNFENVPRAEPELAGLHLVAQDIPMTSAKFDLSLSLQETGEGISGSITFAADLFEPATIECWMRHYRTLLRGMAEDDAQLVAGLPILEGPERRRILEDFNDTRTQWSFDASLVELVARQARRQPDAVAVAYGDVRLSYEELDRRANGVAWALREAGVEDGDYVVTLIEESHRVAIAWLGILKAGAAFVPLDWTRAREDLSRLPSVAACRAVLVEGRAAPGLDSALKSTALPIVRLADTQARQAAPGSAATRDGPIYVMHTSGSTGVPKGVVIEQRSLLNRLFWMSSAMGASAAQTVLKSTHHTFDSAVWQVFWPLINGGCCVIVDVSQLGLQQISQALRAHPIGTLDFVPSVFRAWMEEGADESVPPLCANVIFGGEEVSASDVEWVRTHTGAARVFNLYGATETTIGCVCHEITDRPVGRIPVGRPIANTRAYVLDALGRPVPEGVVGEIYLGGLAVGRGYLEQPQLTRERFLLDPFASDPDSRMYRTGDLGRWRRDGNLECLGRNDDQVKVRGIRVELGEVRAALAACPGVGEAFVAACGAGAERRLVGYYTVADERKLPKNPLAHLRASLPHYLVPAALQRLAAMPLTSAGKVDRTALPTPAALARHAHSDEAPQGEIEEKLAVIWCTLLGVDRVGRHDNFFDLGGHSLLALRAVTLAQRAGLALNTRMIFDLQTLAALGSATTPLPLPGPARRSHEPVPPPAPFHLYCEDPEEALFLIPPAFGGAESYFDLVRRLGEKCPVVLLENVEVHAGRSFTYRQLARYYLDLVLSLAPRGPRALGGISRGAKVAIVMAGQLQARALGLDRLYAVDPHAGVPVEEAVRKRILQDARLADLEELERAFFDAFMDARFDYRSALQPTSARTLLFQAQQSRPAERKPQGPEWRQAILTRLDALLAGYFPAQTNAVQPLNGFEGVLLNAELVPLGLDHDRIFTDEAFALIAARIRAEFPPARSFRGSP
jgi:amino acid adenylation domain-containing protein